jgi:hypothetical protein
MWPDWFEEVQMGSLVRQIAHSKAEKISGTRSGIVRFPGLSQVIVQAVMSCPLLEPKKLNLNG